MTLVPPLVLSLLSLLVLVLVLPSSNIRLKYCLISPVPVSESDDSVCLANLLSHHSNNT